MTDQLFDQIADAVLQKGSPEEAMLFMMEHANSTNVASHEKTQQLRNLSVKWLDQFVEDDSLGSIVDSLASDTNRKRYLRAISKDSGLASIVEFMGEARDHGLSLALEVFLEIVDDPARIDEVLLSQSITLDRGQTLQLHTKKRELL